MAKDMSWKFKICAFATLVLIAATELSAQNGVLLPQFANETEASELYSGVETVRWTAPADEVTPPPSVDNSTSAAFPPIFNQIGGSCAQAATIGYMFTYEVNSLLGRSADIPENRFSYLYSWNFINGGRDEGSLSWDGILLSKYSGIMSEADFPVQTSAYSFRWASGYDKYFRAMHYRVKAFEYMDAGSADGVLALKRYLYDGGERGGKGKVAVFSSASIGWKMDDSYDGPSQTGYRSILLGLPVDGAHAMTIVGYDDTVECRFPDKTTRGAFIVVNSWGTFMHDDGRYYLPYRFFEEEQDAKYILSKEVVGIDVEYVEPVLAFSAGVDYTSRDDLSFSVGAAPEAWAESPEMVWEVNIARNQGGDYPMQGSGFDSEIEFGFDASPIADEAFAMEDVTWFLGVTRNVRGSEGGSGRVTSFKVYDYRGGEDNPTVHTAVLPEDSGIRSGTNWYALRTAEPETTSASPVEWLKTDGQPVKATFIVRTADGGYAKVRFSEYDRKNGKINLRYVYTSDSHLGH